MKLLHGRPLTQSILYAEGCEVVVDQVRLKRVRGVWQPHKDCLKAKLEELTGGPLTVIDGEYELSPEVGRKYQEWLQGLQPRASSEWKSQQ